MKNNELHLREKTGFQILDPETPVIINDFRGIEFYNNSSIPIQNRITFNLPNGIYFIKSGYFEKLPAPIDYKLNELPAIPQRFRKIPKHYNIVFGKNPHKATIFWNKDTILFDNKLAGYTLPQLYYILYHEYAHARFYDETLTDALAENWMLKKGFNPSQVASAPIQTLSSKQKKRKTNTFMRFLNNLK